MEDTKIFYGDVLLDVEDLSERNTKYPIELEYYKTKSCRNNYINEEYEVYGVEIVKKEHIGDEVLTESTCIDNITKNETTLDKIMEMLKNNSVTPVTLNDVISDLKYEK